MIGSRDQKLDPYDTVDMQYRSKEELKKGHYSLKLDPSQLHSNAMDMQFEGGGDGNMNLIDLQQYPNNYSSKLDVSNQQ